MRVQLLAAIALLLLASAPAVVALAPDPLAQLPIPLDPRDLREPVAPLGVDAALDALPEGASAPPALRIPGAAIDPPLVAAAATAGGAALAITGFAQYSRLARNDLLRHETREAVRKLIEAAPGIALSDVAQRAGLAWGTAVYHLERLERAGFLVSERKAGRRCYFVAASVPRAARAGFATLQQGTTRSIAAFVAARPGATQTELCEGLGLSASAASKQVSKLESAGLVRRERESKAVRLHPEAHLATILG